MLVVLLPAYNEADSIGPLLQGLGETFRGLDSQATVLLVGDGSSDDTVQRAKDAAGEFGVPLEIELHGTNRGLGAALRTGFERANRMLGGSGVLVGMDADNTHDPSVIPSMLAKLDEGNDVVIASRYAPGGREVGLSAMRSLLSKGASLTMRTFLPVRGARDYSCGYRAYDGRALARALEAYGGEFIVESGFVASAEILVKMAYLPSRVAEVPLVLRYDRKGGASKMNIGRTIARYMRLISAGKRAIAARSRAAKEEDA